MDLTRYDKLRSAIRRTLSPDEAAAADRALEYAAEHTASQVRHDGSPMLDHAAEVARIGLEEIGLGGDSVVAAILHDVVRTASRQDEETFLRLTDEIRDRFGKEVLGMTVSLSHISDIRLKASREQAENFRELIVSYSEDPRVILIKLADRLEVMRRLEIFPREKWRKKSWESLNLYAQIAHKLGLYNQERTRRHRPALSRTPGLPAYRRQTGRDRKRTPGLHRPRPRTHHAAARPGGAALSRQEPHQVDLLDLEQDAQAARPVRGGI